jgi:2-polyprenyl-6-methoxyphenol hydroxylase-like FAD-dependent oxidoreductase
MMGKPYDVIVLGARCAGSPLAMLLARRGYRVLLVDKATFPSDTISTHIVQPRGVAALSRWGLLDDLIATGCPPIHTYSFDFGPISISGTPGNDEAPAAYCPRRIILDALLVNAAADAAVEVREGFTVDQILIEDDRVVGVRGHSRGGASVTERATVVVGADGRRSMLAATVAPRQYHERPPLLAGYYSYWSGLPMDDRYDIFIRERRGFGAAPTHDGLTLIVGGWPYAEFETNKKDVERSFLDMLDLAPSFAARVRDARREAPFVGMPVANFFRTASGPGWVLVGDAGYTKDPITAQGISDAFRDAERCSAALDAALSGRESFECAMTEYQRERDEQALPMYELTCQLASLEPPPPEMLQLLQGIYGNRTAMDGFVRMNAGTISPAEFFSPEHLGPIMAAAPH